MIVQNTKKQPKPAKGTSVKTSPASKSAAPEIYASHGTIEERAFQMFEDRGSNHGNDLQDWLLAENQLTDPQIPAR